MLRGKLEFQTFCTQDTNDFFGSRFGERLTRETVFLEVRSSASITEFRVIFDWPVVDRGVSRLSNLRHEPFFCANKMQIEFNLLQMEQVNSQLMVLGFACFTSIPRACSSYAVHLWKSLLEEEAPVSSFVKTVRILEK